MAQFPNVDEEVNSAAAFLDLLQEIPQEVDLPLLTSPWVYRGHGDAAWELKPPAWRADGQGKLKPLLDFFRPRVASAFEGRQRPIYAVTVTAEPQESEIARCTQIVAEVFAVYQFCNLADELGLPVPGGATVPTTEAVLNRLFPITMTSGSSWLFPTIPIQQPIIQLPESFGGWGTELFPHEPFAFAQHHGIPTRFLDWTRNPLTAAWFAADSTTGNHEEGKICVWAANTNDADFLHGTWITVPRHPQSYLHAQDGIFYHPYKDPTIESLGGKATIFGPGSHKVHKLSLPRSEAPKLLELLYKKRISRAHLMPTFDNVGTAVRSIWPGFPAYRWDTPEKNTQSPTAIPPPDASPSSTRSTAATEIASSDASTDGKQ